MLKCTVNGKAVEVPEGTKVIEAFKLAETDIAHYCWHPGLSVAGVCRLCMVEVEGAPRLGVACNMDVTDGMVVNNNSKKVKEAVKWGLDFHLINHPLDCPICDQAGECGLQDQYMKFGQYDPEMSEQKVKKRKVVDLGPRVVLDTERCILCSRCVRFTDEVSKSGELGIFNRGDHSEIGTHKDKPLDNNYSVNTVDICPVGALTSKDFRFKQRVWYLDNQKSVCPGCSTGCNVDVYFNEKGHFRLQPHENQEVNSYWMCDKGRDTLEHVNKEHRLLKAQVKSSGGSKWLAAGAAAKLASEALNKYQSGEIAVVFTGSYTSEEYKDSLKLLTKKINLKRAYHWVNNKDSFDSFDGLLIRGDKNPNTAGLIRNLQESSFENTWEELIQHLQSGGIKAVVVAGPEIHANFPEFDEVYGKLRKAETLVWASANPKPCLDTADYLIPMKSWVEKTGTFVNHEGLEQKSQKTRTIVSDALSLSQFTRLLCGEELGMEA